MPKDKIVFESIFVAYDLPLHSDSIICKNNEEINTILSGELEKYAHVFFGWLKIYHS